ncbi:DUF4232 domain-containing protein [Streptomyces sp. NRRL S-340]|uniref:DUF4232 domain-containing protein n=1 Tax=Streptomyces sp. NRRL S-340 TaxID=1463901 RepID=UPI00056970BD|nr:DUF4232 domain-containing protein [Streptomyces sp. NRRL S-340]
MSLSPRTRRPRRTRLFTAAAVAAAALSLTACQAGGDDSGAGAASSAAPAGSVQNEQPSGAASADPQSPAGTGSGAGSGAGAGSGSGSTAGKGGSVSGGTAKGGGSGKGSQASGSSDASSGELAKCGAKSLRLKAAEVSRPLNHLLLTATNTGSRTCMLPMYPATRFGEAQSVPPTAEDTKPQALTTLEPGQSGYAGVLLSGDGGHGHTVHTLTIPFDDGSIATVRLPAQGVFVDDKLTVSYWESTMAPAVDF